MPDRRDENRSYSGKVRSGTTALVFAAIVIVGLVAGCLVVNRKDVGPDVPQSVPTGPFRGSQ